MEEWLCGGSELPAANIFFYFSSKYCSVAVWQCGGALDTVRQSLSKIQISLDRWKNGCVEGPGYLLSIFFLLLSKYCSVAVWWCGRALEAVTESLS